MIEARLVKVIMVGCLALFALVVAYDNLIDYRSNFLVWFLGFMVVAGEWFAMWQSKSWNGQEAAFRFYMPILAVLIFVNQRND